MYTKSVTMNNDDKDDQHNQPRRSTQQKLTGKSFQEAPRPRPTSGHYPRDSLTHPMLIIVYLHFRPKGHREPRNEVGSQIHLENYTNFQDARQ